MFFEGLWLDGYFPVVLPHPAMAFKMMSAEAATEEEEVTGADPDMDSSDSPPVDPAPEEVMHEEAAMDEDTVGAEKATRAEETTPAQEATSVEEAALTEEATDGEETTFNEEAAPADESILNDEAGSSGAAGQTLKVVPAAGSRRFISSSTDPSLSQRWGNGSTCW